MLLLIVSSTFKRNIYPVNIKALYTVKTEAILTQLTGFNPPLFISKYQAVKHRMHLQAHRLNKQSKCIGRNIITI
jgi:hypothetical protein